MSLWHKKWHVAWLAEWHNYVERIIYAEWPFFGANQAHCRNSIFRTSKILLVFISRAAWQHPYYSTKVVYWRKDLLEGQAPFYFNFSAKDVCTINFTVSFYLYLYLQPRECFFFRRWVTWSWYSEMKLILYFVSFSCLAKFPALEANGWRRRAGLSFLEKPQDYRGEDMCGRSI